MVHKNAYDAKLQIIINKIPRLLRYLPERYPYLLPNILGTNNGSVYLNNFNGGRVNGSHNRNAIGHDEYDKDIHMAIKNIRIRRNNNSYNTEDYDNEKISKDNYLMKGNFLEILNNPRWVHECSKFGTSK
jgi:hypothetical protein